MNILELPLPFVTPRDVLLPHRDAFGVLHGIDYDPSRKASAMGFGTRASFGGVKFVRTLESLSMNETRPLFSFGFNPYVLDVREEYPVYEQKDYDRAKIRGVRMSSNKVMTIDIVLTLVLPPDNRLHYHGISIKDARSIDSEKTQKRHQREKDKFRR